VAIIAAFFPHIREPLLKAAAMNTSQSPLQHDVASMIVTTLNLDTVKPEQIDPAAPLFGAGLGLDSIDALELALEISKRYGFQLRSDDEDNRRIFASLANLSAHIEQNRAK
jgi:acyl carrier protein